MFSSTKDIKKKINGISIALLDKTYDSLKAINNDIAIGYVKGVNDLNFLLTGSELKDIIAEKHSQD